MFAALEITFNTTHNLSILTDLVGMSLVFNRTLLLLCAVCSNPKGYMQLLLLTTNC